MNELVKLVSERTGIPQATAKQAVETVIGFLKQKLPAPIASQIDGVLQSPDLGAQASNLRSRLRGLLRRK